MPGIITRHHHNGQLTVTTINGHRLRGPDITDQPIAEPGPHFTVTVDHTAVAEPGQLITYLAGTHPYARQLRQDLIHSVTGLQLARSAARRHPHHGQLFDTAHAFHPEPSVFFEQLVVDGHPVHPMCRTRGRLTATQIAANAPEHHPVVTATLAAVHPSDAHQQGAWPWRDQHGRPLLPIHPLQSHHLTATSRLTTSPLMSLRTLAPHATPQLHIKTTVDAQMTSAVRHISPASIHNGPIVSDIAHRVATGVHVQRETATLAIRHNGSTDPRLAAIARQSPAALLPRGQVAIPLAALAARDTEDDRPLVADVITASHLSPRQWWNACLTALIPPVLRLLRYGIALEAHGQNTLLAVDNGIPQAIVYRDFGGVRIDRDLLHDHGIACPRLHGDLETSHTQYRHTKLIAATYSVAIHQLVDALTRAYPHQAAGQWWQPVADITATATADDPALRTAILRDRWPIKATTAMRLADNPVEDQWATISNPLAAQ